MIINNNVQTHVTTINPKLPNYTHDYITTMSMIIYFLHLPSPNECLCIRGVNTNTVMTSVNASKGLQ